MILKQEYALKETAPSRNFECTPGKSALPDFFEPTSLILQGARYYDPTSGRFISPDPLGHSVTPDLYSYANGDPVNFVDPTGLGQQPTADSPGDPIYSPSYLRQLQQAQRGAINNALRADHTRAERQQILAEIDPLIAQGPVPK